MGVKTHVMHGPALFLSIGIISLDQYHVSDYIVCMANKNDMKRGDKFSIAGYDVQAKVTSMSGLCEIVLMHNNSTHYLVATRNLLEDELSDGRHSFEASFAYGDDLTSTMQAYAQAMERVYRISIAN